MFFFAHFPSQLYSDRLSTVLLKCSMCFLLIHCGWIFKVSKYLCSRDAIGNRWLNCRLNYLTHIIFFFSVSCWPIIQNVAKYLLISFRPSWLKQSTRCLLQVLKNKGTQVMTAMEIKSKQIKISICRCLGLTEWDTNQQFHIKVFQTDSQTEKHPPLLHTQTHSCFQNSPKMRWYYPRAETIKHMEWSVISRTWKVKICGDTVVKG